MLGFAELMVKLRAGEPIAMFAIGSSVTGAHGGCTAPAPGLASPECASRCPDCCGSLCKYSYGHWPPYRYGLPGAGWAVRVLSWINETWPREESEI